MIKWKELIQLGLLILAAIDVFTQGFVLMLQLVITLITLID